MVERRGRTRRTDRRHFNESPCTDEQAAKSRLKQKRCARIIACEESRMLTEKA